MAQQDRPEEKAAIRTTIVGGRPPGCGQDVGAIPRGIEVLVKKASVDPAFKELLLQQRAEAAATIGLHLEPAEALMLAAVPADQLEATIARTKVRDVERRAFLGTAAAAMLATFAAARAGEDEPPKSRGISPVRPGIKTVEDGLRVHETARKGREAACIAIATWFSVSSPQSGMVAGVAILSDAVQPMHATVNAKGERAVLKDGMATPLAPLVETDVTILTAALPKLPEDQAAVAVANALFISCRDGDAWKTRQYDRKALPPDVAAIKTLLGMPPENQEPPRTKGHGADNPKEK